MTRWYAQLHSIFMDNLFKSQPVFAGLMMSCTYTVRLAAFTCVNWSKKKLPVSIGVTHIDGLVLARSAFHHSVNYRSVVIFSNTELVTDKAELYTALKVFTNKMQPGRWDDIRQPNESEWKKTMLLKFKIEEASAKIRTGGPIDDDEDYDLNIWAGVVPLKLERKPLVVDQKLKGGINVPDYLK